MSRCWDRGQTLTMTAKKVFFSQKSGVFSIADFSQQRLVRLRLGWCQTKERWILYKTVYKRFYPWKILSSLKSRQRENWRVENSVFSRISKKWLLLRYVPTKMSRFSDSPWKTASTGSKTSEKNLGKRVSHGSQDRVLPPSGSFFCDKWAYSLSHTMHCAPLRPVVVMPQNEALITLYATLEYGCSVTCPPRARLMGIAVLIETQVAPLLLFRSLGHYHGIAPRF